MIEQLGEARRQFGAVVQPLIGQPAHQLEAHDGFLGGGQGLVLGRDDDALLPGGRCDLALLINVYHHMRAGAAFLRRLVPTLARDARVVNIDWDEQAEWGPPPRRRVPRARFLRDARRAGLRLIAEHRFLPHQYFFVLRRTG